MARFGGNEFTNYSVPLVFAGRAFLLEPRRPIPLTSVVVEAGGGFYFEILKNNPGESPVSVVESGQTGEIVVRDKQTARLLYKVRPASETSVVFGTLAGEEGVSARITDRFLQVGGVKLENSVFNGVMAGVLVNPDGSIGIGAAIPPRLAQWLMGTDAVERVLKALRNPKWDWRTLPGIAHEAGLPEDQVLQVIESLRSSVERGKTTDKQEDVYRLRPTGVVTPPSSSSLFWSYITKSTSSRST